MKNILPILLLPILFYSCVEEYTIDVVQPTKTLVVNSFITPDSVFSCWLTHTYAINDTLSHAIEEATVKIFDEATNTLLCELKHSGRGYYRAENVFPVAEKSYRLEVKSNGYPEVSATTYIPKKQTAANIYTLFNAGYEAWEISYFDEFHFTITDTDPDNNYYTFTYWEVGETDHDYNFATNEKIPLNDTIMLVSDARHYASYSIVDAVIQNEGLMKYNPSFLYFSDELFNQQKHDFTIRGEFGFIRYVIFTLYTLNPDFYKYQTSLMHQLYENGEREISRFDDFAGLDFSNDAVPLYSNIKGGYGIFAGYNTFKKYAPNPKPYLYDDQGNTSVGYENIIRFEYDTIPPYYEIPPHE